MSKLFGTDGVRGVANKELNVELAYKLGKAGAFILSKEKNAPKILVGSDSRISGDMLEAALISGMCSIGANVFCAGVISTPAIAYLTKTQGFDCGVMISASHNPYEYNGIKFFNKDGFKLDDQIQDEIEDIILNNKELPLATGKNIGTKSDYKKGEELYIDYLVSTTKSNLKGKTVVLDCANGASSFVAPKVFEKLGATVIATSNTPNGVNINENCGSTHPENLCKTVIENNADCGFAFDGDADRIIAVSHKGEIVDGDKMISFCAKHLKEQGKLKGNTAVVTIMSNMGLFKAMEQNGIETKQTKVGDRYVLEEMLKGNYSIGGEQSGHIIFLEHATTGDGVLSAVQITTVMDESGKTLEELSHTMEIWPQVLINAKVQSGKQKTYPDYPEIMERIDILNKAYEGNGRLVIRPSGTEPVIRVMIEGQDLDKITKDAKDLADFIEKTVK